MADIDNFDLRILMQLQLDGGISQRDLANRVGLSQNACWRRLQRLSASGLIKGTSTQIDLAGLGLDLTVIVMVRTHHHTKEWADRFRKHVERLPDVIDFHRIGGDWDYMIKVVTKGMSGYDNFYQRLIANFDLDRVTGLFSMEAIVENRSANLIQLLSPAVEPNSKTPQKRSLRKSGSKVPLRSPSKVR